jgi:protein-S-isoprenylcysteine O-methyltransferase Ste14
MEVKYIALLIVMILTLNRLRIVRKSPTYKKRQKKDTSKRWTYSILFIFYILGTGIVLGSVFENLFLVKKLNLFLSSLGLVASVSAMVVRNKAIKALGEDWSTRIEAKKGQRIVKNGPYKYIRHPGYLSIIIESLAVPVILNAYYTLIGVILIYIPVILLTAKLEDREMQNKIGNSFIVYKEKTGAFLPKNVFDYIMPYFKKKNLKQ